MTDFHVMAGAEGRRYEPRIARIGVADVLEALRLGLEDFWAKPSHYVFLCLIYPVAGLVLASWTSGANALPLIYPLISGFALLGPIAAIGLYEISRRREAGIDASWTHALDVRHSPALPAIAVVGALLLVLFLVWLYAAQLICASMFGPEPPASIGVFIRDVLTTAEGWRLIVVGNLVGFVFALVALSVSVIAFPLLLDRDVGAVAAIQASASAVVANPGPMLLWGLIVAVALVVGSLPLLAGLAIVMPILGHATWHLYRKVVARPEQHAVGLR
jgi:uncharacterized membrane protein